MTKLSEADRDKLPASKFAEPGKRAYPIEDAAHVSTPDQFQARVAEQN